MSTGGSPVRAYDFLLKFLLVGDSDVGKGEILASLQDGAAESPYGHPAGEHRAGKESGWSARGPGRRRAQVRERGREGQWRSGGSARGLRRKGDAGPGSGAEDGSKGGRGGWGGAGSRRGALGGPGERSADQGNAGRGAWEGKRGRGGAGRRGGGTRGDRGREGTRTRGRERRAQGRPGSAWIPPALRGQPRLHPLPNPGRGGPRQLMGVGLGQAHAARAAGASGWIGRWGPPDLGVTARRRRACRHAARVWGEGVAGLLRAAPQGGRTCARLVWKARVEGTALARGDRSVGSERSGCRLPGGGSARGSVGRGGREGAENKS